MKILMLSYDSQLAGFDDNESIRRHIAYAKHVERMDIIVPALDTGAYSKSDNLIIHHIKHRTLPLLWWSIYRYTDRLCGHLEVDIITSQDALLGIIALPIREKHGCKFMVNIFGTEFLKLRWLLGNPLQIVYSFIMRYVSRRADMIRVDYKGAKLELNKKLNIPLEKIKVIRCIPFGLEAFTKADGMETRRKLLMGDMPSADVFRMLDDIMGSRKIK